MPRPTQSARKAVLNVEIPAGWYTTINAISRKPYQHLVSITNSLFPRSKNLLRSKRDKPGEMMTDFRSGATSIVMAAQAEPSRVEFTFYHSKAKVSSSAITTLENDKFLSDDLQVLNFSKPAMAKKSIPDYQMFMVFVQDAPNTVPTGTAYDDAVITIYCVQADETEIKPVKPSSKYPLYNIQADIVPGLTKSIEYFYFFEIADITHFRKAVGTFVLLRVTTAEQISVTKVQPSGVPVPGEPFVGLSVGFSSTGLKMLGFRDSLKDESFERGQLRDAKNLGDSGTERSGIFYPDWDVEFKADIHGIFQITTHDETIVKAFIDELESAFLKGPRRSAIRKILLFRAAFRPQPHTLNEHFGYRDGISKPEIEGVTFDRENKPMRFPGSPLVDMGLLVMGYDGDEDKNTRPSWAVDGSFLVFRKLKSLVPEFNDFVHREGRKIFPHVAPDKAADRFGARLFGRWKSGTPIVLAPDEDDPKIAADNNLLNNFDYRAKDQAACPFGAHTRKSFPRGDLASSKRHLFRRAGIPYGPELNPDEKHETIDDRGLVFICYQSSIVRGFKFIQQNFNNTNFPPSNPIEPGYDPIVGQTGLEKQSVHRYMSGTNPVSQADKLTFPIQFIQSSGGEYFFLPSISTLAMIAM